MLFFSVVKKKYFKVYFPKKPPGFFLCFNLPSAALTTPINAGTRKIGIYEFWYRGIYCFFFCFGKKKVCLMLLLLETNVLSTHKTTPIDVES